ncbi:MAG: hypothetical protein J6T27_01845 [Alphaproteobacteria bacterium]|nr:hypothetical protein [Alphaproteobacteria bacterium]
MKGRLNKMKKIVFGFLLSFLPINLLADVCVNPSEYTVDRRCYVDDATWSTKPYKHVLKMKYIDDDLVFCTANMVSGKILTARHCISDAKIGELEFIAFDGSRIRVQQSFSGASEFVTSDQDWIVFMPISAWQDFVSSNSIRNISDDFVGAGKNSEGIIAGFGGLKILSDQEILNFQKAYKEYIELFGSYFDSDDTEIDENSVNLTDTIKDDKKKYLFYDTISPYLLKYDLPEVKELFFDTEQLKVGFCKDIQLMDGYDILGVTKCQAWGGNSGGGLYVDKNEKGLWYLMGLLLGGKSVISSDPDKHTGKRSIIGPAKNFKNNI